MFSDHRQRERLWATPQSEGVRWITAGRQAADIAKELHEWGKKRVVVKREIECESNKGMKKSPSLCCTSTHMGLPAAAVNVMITLTTAAITAARGKTACSSFSVWFFNTCNHPQVTTDDATHTPCKCHVKNVFAVNSDLGLKPNKTVPTFSD